MGIFGTKLESTISFDTSNRELTVRWGIFIFDKITTFSNIEMFRVTANTENEFVFSTQTRVVLLNWFEALYIFYRLRWPLLEKIRVISNFEIRGFKAHAGWQTYIINSFHNFLKQTIWNPVQMLQTYCKYACAFLRRKNIFWQIDCFSELRNIFDYHEYLIKW